MCRQKLMCQVLFWMLVHSGEQMSPRAHRAAGKTFIGQVATSTVRLVCTELEDLIENLSPSCETLREK